MKDERLGEKEKTYAGGQQYMLSPDLACLESAFASEAERSTSCGP